MNTIIMAAGTGIRLRPWTNDRPKGLVEIEGIPIIERQIRFFRERGVEEIVIIAGHQAQRFDSLIARYPDITLVLNDKYDAYNNIYSMYLVRDRLGDSYVSEADVFMHENYVLPRPDRSLIFGGSRKGFAKEWIVRFDENRRIRRIDVQGGAGIIQAGLSFWTKGDAPLLRDKLKEIIDAGDFGERYWDDVFMSLFDRLDVFLHEIDPGAWTEIDAPSDLVEARKRERRLRA